MVFSWYVASFGKYNETYGLGCSHRLYDLDMAVDHRRPAWRGDQRAGECERL